MTMRVVWDAKYLAHLAKFGKNAFQFEKGESSLQNKFSDTNNTLYFSDIIRRIWFMFLQSPISRKNFHKKQKQLATFSVPRMRSKPLPNKQSLIYNH